MFQSTRPVRGATSRSAALQLSLEVSIHAPRTGRDVHAPGNRNSGEMFQSTRPVRGATSIAVAVSVGGSVSIHAPRTGRDAQVFRSNRQVRLCFNPRAPYGARRQFRRQPGLPQPCFNPRAPYGARLFPIVAVATLSCFNPRAPYGARLRYRSP